MKTKQLKVWTKVEMSDGIEYEYDAHDFDYKVSIEIQAWEHYDVNCDIDHPNWKKFNEKYEVVAIANGFARENDANIRIQYDIEFFEEYRSNLLIKRALKNATVIIKEKLDEYYNG
ncbi:hypothetical protein [Cohnella luojiensis]|uniref:Uncharacterized protein n=1 Tax=Cohnella luojiensis TaxID=652876 RepID=A0A4Y8LNA0_9BACL|nr:hypothetical protein [Cohnella luojiensis]TFE19740.1 hypothetical protein E2980_22310 [Cohnella luojiensis]